MKSIQQPVTQSQVKVRFSIREPRRPTGIILFLGPGKSPTKWIRGALIGAGSFGSVYLGMNPMNGSLMAVKQVELPTGYSHNEERKKSMLDALEREIELLKVLQHESSFSFLSPHLQHNANLMLACRYRPIS